MYMLTDEGEIRERMQDMCSAVHCVSVVSWSKNALQEDGRLSDLQQDQERMSDLSAGSGIW